MKIFKVSGVFIVLMLTFTRVSFSQDETADNNTGDTAAAAAPAETSQPVETSPGNVTMDFKDADINNVLRILSYKSGMNIVAGKDVAGLITIRLNDVPWEKALDVILRTYGYAYEREGNIIRVTTTANLENEELMTEVFPLNYAKAKDVPDAIKEVLSSRGKVKFDERTNLLIVTDIATNIYKIRQVVERLDTRTWQVNIEAKIIETTLDKDDKLGINWTTQITATGAERPVTFPFDRTNEGGDYFPVGDTSAAASTTVGKFSTSRPGSFPLAVPANFSFGTLDFTSFQAVLEVLKSRTDTRIVSNPRLTTLNNQEATIHVGTAMYVPEYEESASTGSPVFKDMKKTELETGVKLKVTPHVNSNKEIVVDIVPEVSTLGTKTALATSSSGDTVFAFPVSIRTAKAQVMIKDGETIVIGGLIKETETDTVVKVPILGDIPVLSLLFKKKEKALETTDLLFFITVNLIKADSGTAVVSK
ncbi:MAG: secretin N-terminal domain-containing protein [Candidatus Omnitrophota bacterium]|nr:secretin N-terminal domain-containing protein [Candidatus Omnitrophota bacterium]